MLRFKVLSFIVLIISINYSCKQSIDTDSKLTLITLDPGHFHAALIQKSSLSRVDTNVFIFAPQGKELETHLSLIEQFNSREKDPTNWNEIVYSGDDFLEKMLQQRKGSVVVLAGNNENKTDYIVKAAEAGFHVLSDKPMAIDTKGFLALKDAFEYAEENNVSIYDIMTERFNIYSIIQKELVNNEEIFGEFAEGSIENPSIIKTSLHHFYKTVSGKPLIRPAWYYDVEQQGEGIVDVTTHFIDLIHWQCFPDQTINYQTDIDIHSAKRWPTVISESQFQVSTGENKFPEYLEKHLNNDQLDVYANGEIVYSVNDIFSKVKVEWNFEADKGLGDTHFSIIKGTKSNITIRQGQEQGYKPKLYIEPVDKESFTNEEIEQISKALQELKNNYSGLSLVSSPLGLEVIIPESLIEGHEDHFSHVANNFFDYVHGGKMPDWEVPNMIAKYYITTQALDMAKSQ